MREIIKTYSEEYASNLKRFFNVADDLQNVNHPALFIFIGDDSLDALKAVYSYNQSKWNNHNGILYLYVHTEEPFYSENVLCFRLTEPLVDIPQYRKVLKDEFYKDENRIVELNQVIRQLSGRLTDTGKLFSQFDTLNISVVTRVDDPTNVIIPEISILTKKIMEESFAVNLELYALIKERNDGENHYRSTAFGISFFRELQYYQTDPYSFAADLEITEDRIAMAVEHHSARLFSLAYILSDRDEEGRTEAANMEKNYEIISMLNLLKNRSVIKSIDSKNEYYDNARFIQNIQNGHKEPLYVSAGFSKVIRPNSTIAITTLYHFYKQYLQKIKEPAETSKMKIMALLGIDQSSISSKVGSFVPGKETLENSWTGLMKNRVSFQQLKNLTMRQAEQLLHSTVCESTFTKVFLQPVSELLDQLRVKDELAELIKKNIAKNNQFGLYCAYLWTAEDVENGIINLLRGEIKGTTIALETSKAELELFYGSQVGKENFKCYTWRFCEKKNIQNFSLHLMNKIYGQKLKILYLETSLQYLKRVENALLEIHEEYKQQLEQLKYLERFLYQTARTAVEWETEYLSRNIFEYYEKIVSEILRELEEKRNERFYFEERFLGNIEMKLENGLEYILRKFISVCQKEILTHSNFSKTVEKEMLERTNLDVHYGHQEVLTKHGLFQELYNRLKKNATIHISLNEEAFANRYEEKYFFGDFESEFIQWSFQYDKDDRKYKLGCVHKENSSGIEKLNIMGGFKITDLKYYENNLQNYEHYLKAGFEFHGINTELLPTLNTQFMG